MLARLIAMISAERMKSVRIAPATFSSSSALASTAEDAACAAFACASCGASI